MLAKCCNKLGDGGVVISRKRVNKSLTEQEGKRSWGFHVLTTPAITLLYYLRNLQEKVKTTIGSVSFFE